MIITGFANSPDRGRGFARDMVVRWALEELGLGYEIRSLTFEQMKQADHLRLNPFGQIPSLEMEGMALFETGAILMVLSQSYPGLLPDELALRGRAASWMFASVATVEPVIVEREAAILTEADQDWFQARLPMLEDRIHNRLSQVAEALKEADWLLPDFSAADILMVSALRRLDRPLLDQHPRLAAYVDRATARPAYRRAYKAQHDLWLSYQS